MIHFHHEIAIDIQFAFTDEGITGRVAMIDTAQPRHGRVTTGNEWRCPASDDACSTTVKLDGFPKIISLRAVAPEG